MVLVAPHFSRAQSVHSACLRSGEATFVSCASALARVQKSSFVALGSRKCAQRCEKPKIPALTCYDLPSGLHPQHNAVIKNRYTRNDPVPHQLGHAALTALMRNSSFFLLFTTLAVRSGERGTGDPSPRLLTQQPTGYHITHPSPSLFTLCFQRRLQRHSRWVEGREREGKKGYLLTEQQRAASVTSRTRGRGSRPLTNG